MRRYITVYRYYHPTLGCQLFAGTLEEAKRKNPARSDEVTKLFAYNRGKYGQIAHINSLSLQVATGQTSGLTNDLEYLSFFSSKQPLANLGFPIRGRIKEAWDVYPT